MRTVIAFPRVRPTAPGARSWWERPVHKPTLDPVRVYDDHLAVTAKLLWFAGLLLALMMLTNFACGPKEKFCANDPNNKYHCRPDLEEAGAGGDGGENDPCDGAGQVVRNGMLVCNFQ